MVIVSGKEKTEAGAKIEVEGKIVAETLGGNTAGIGGSADTTKQTVAFIVPAGKKWKPTTTVGEEKFFYSYLTL
jgi:hypothetical protein